MQKKGKIKGTKRYGENLTSSVEKVTQTYKTQAIIVNLAFQNDISKKIL